MIYSATSAMEMNIFFNHITKVFFWFNNYDYSFSHRYGFLEKNAFYFYLIFLILLVWASFYGHIGKGSRRWIEISGFYFQPSEFMKIFIILSLAKIF